MRMLRWMSEATREEYVRGVASIAEKMLENAFVCLGTLLKRCSTFSLHFYARLENTASYQSYLVRGSSKK